MKDFNFFEPYIGSKKGSSNDKNKFILAIGAIAVALVVVAVPSYIQVRTVLVQRELKEGEQLLSRKDSKEKLEDLDYKEEVLKSMKAQNEKIQTVDKALDEKDVVGSHLIDSISESLPQDIFLNRLSIDRTEISMDCISEEKDNIAYFENNIRKLNYFENIFIPRISLEDRFYAFTLDMQLKGGKGDSDNAENEESKDKEEERDEEVIE